MGTDVLPAGMQVFERGWLSSNNVLLTSPTENVLIDTGYWTHSAQTLALVEHALQGQALQCIVNTHLHSDHCGGNAALQARFPKATTLIPPGLSQAVRTWDQKLLTYEPTGQHCPPFALHGVLTPGSSLTLAEMRWQVHAAPGHDPHAVVLFQPDHSVLISADALWGNGFGVVFPEIDGIAAFEEVRESLDMIESLAPTIVIPGHGAVFTDVSAALARARSRLHQFESNPATHAAYASKVLLKFKLMEWQRISREEAYTWAQQSIYLKQLHECHFATTPFAQWFEGNLLQLEKSNALTLTELEIHNR